MDKAFSGIIPSNRSLDNFMPAIDMYEDKDSVIVD
jgi:hypothetical protein